MNEELKNISIIILCGGSSKRWNNYLNVEKQFVKINNDILIERTINELKKNTNNITIISRHDNINKFKHFNVNIYPIKRNESEIEYFKILSTTNFWNPNGKTIILMGDVWLTKRAFKLIMFNTRKEILFFGRQSKNFYTKCSHGEIFAISFYPIQHSTISNAVEKLKNYFLYSNLKISAGWGIYNIVSKIEFLMTGPKIITGKALNHNFIQILDCSDDIDYPSDYENLKKTINKSDIVSAIKTFIYYKYLYLHNYAFKYKYLK